ncbi:MAG: relaxase domain-containing protein, partial [Hyphomicrobiales bacterium]|nr:relaxase domain-containing protein [Hyphomicrobiales bacterium]
MTARVTTLKGVDAGAYYVEALPSYYLDSNEPPGRWHGRGADILSLRGEIRDEDFLDIMAGVHPGSRGLLLGRAYGESSVRGFDITANAPKSVSVLFAVGDDFVRHEALASHDAAVAEMIRWIEAHAHTRFRINGEVAVVDAEGIVAATFRQHTSRALDPHLHTHVVVANRVRSPDGRWLALDARTLKLDQRTLSAIYHATLRSELTARLGVHWEPVENGIAEIDGIDKIVLEEFSSRTADVARRFDEKLDRFIDTLDRDPTPRERWQLEREAVIDSRPPKAHGIDGQALHEQWRMQVQILGLDPAMVVDEAVWPSRARPLTAKVESSMISQALHALAEKQSSWRPAEITRELAAVLPSDLRIDPEAITSILDRLTAEAIGERCVDISRPIPDEATLRRDGRPITEAATDRALTTPEILVQEHELAGWAERRTTARSNDSTAAPRRAEVELTAAQTETAAAVAGDAHLVLVVGPAGTGKTTSLKPAVEQLHAEGRAVFGLAPSAGAAEVLSSETGTTADTIDKLLFEHSANRPPTHTYDLPHGTTVIVDEAGMMSTDKLHRFARLADDRAWRVVLVGDPMQFSAVGRGGMFEYLIDTCGAIELDHVHRFSNEWERAASLQLRRGDPSAATVYNAHGRLHDGTATRVHREALDAWYSARQLGETVLLTAPTNETVNALNRAAQQRRVDAGELDTRRHLPLGDGRLYVGDEIVTRRNRRQLLTDQNHMVRNRDQWTITALHRNG